MTYVITNPVQATLVESVYESRHIPGAYNFFKDGLAEVAGLNYVCPCGCERVGALHFKPRQSPSWDWDGNRLAPTLTPSVHHVDHWHGWLRAGLWTSC